MELLYREERDSDFFNVCETIRKKHGKDYISTEDIAREAVYKEAKSFYIKETDCYVIIKKVRSGALEYVRAPHKKELYKEIYNRYIRVKRENPELKIIDCARIISNQKVPRFYISEGRAVNLYYELLKK